MDGFESKSAGQLELLMSRESNQGGQGSGVLMALTRMGLIAPRLETTDLWWLNIFGPVPEAAKRKPSPDPEEDEDEDKTKADEEEEDEEDDDEDDDDDEEDDFDNPDDDDDYDDDDEDFDEDE